jgi:hypothetical protein
LARLGCWGNAACSTPLRRRPAVHVYFAVRPMYRGGGKRPLLLCRQRLIVQGILEDLFASPVRKHKLMLHLNVARFRLMASVVCRVDLSKRRLAGEYG